MNIDNSFYDIVLTNTHYHNMSSGHIESAQPVASPSIIYDYFKLTHEYQSKYGHRTVVLLQVGAFFEVYAVRNPFVVDAFEYGPIQLFTDTCRLNIADKKMTFGSGPSPHSKESGPGPSSHSMLPPFSKSPTWIKTVPPCAVVMAGIRDYQLDKYIHLLTDSGCTAVVYVQEKSGKDNKTISRVFQGVYSPGTYLGYDLDATVESATESTNNVMCIWMDHIVPPLGSNRSTTCICGISMVNILTGAASMFEHQIDTTSVKGDESIGGSAAIANASNVGESFHCEAREKEARRSFGSWLTPSALDELERCMSTHMPSEVIIIHSFSSAVLQSLLQCLSIGTIGGRSVAVHTISMVDGADTGRRALVERCTQQTYIQQLLGTFYSADAFYQCIEFQTHIVATQSLCYLLNFIQEHNPDLVRNLALPTFSNTSHRVSLANHTLRQLNILETNEDHGVRRLSSVAAFLNRCVTAMGRRRLRDQLTHPTSDVEWLEREYAMVDWARPHDTTEIRKRLEKVRDLEKMSRQLTTRRLYPSMIYHLYQSLQAICEVDDRIRSMQLSEGSMDGSHIAIHCPYPYDKSPGYDAFATASLPPRLSCADATRDLCQRLKDTWNLETCQVTNTMSAWDELLFRAGVSPELDAIIETQMETKQKILQWQQELGALVAGCGGGSNTNIDTTEYIKWHETDKSGISFQITKKRGVILKKALANVQSLAKTTQTLQHSLAGDLPIHDIRLVSATTTNDEIEFPALSAASKLLLSLKDRLKCAQETIFRTVLDTMTQDPQTYTIFRQCAEYVAQLDVILCKAYVSNTYHYVRPTLCSNDRDQTPASMVRARGLRHVLIEHIQTQEIYVTNDIALGENNTMVGSEHGVGQLESNPSGILLYGTNAVGKTSLIRALGICVIMAQAGWYVPCTEFVLRPYRAIFSRILGNDNLFKGLSTFAVEMSELRLILNQADAHSLVLGDELCSGTETESALSIFMAGIQWLDRSRASFLFATHFHEIIHYEEMRQLSRVCLKHMSVIYDRALDCLIYDRKLRDGPGNRMYGLEVCKSFHLPTDFLEMAYTIRNKYHSMESGVGSGTLSHPTSHYNAKKVRSMCEMCNETLGEEIHHLQPQQLADSDGYIGHFHKNHVANLMSICSACHDKIHSSDSISPNNLRASFSLASQWKDTPVAKQPGAPPGRSWVSVPCDTKATSVPLTLPPGFSVSDPSIASSLSIVSKKTAGGGVVRKKTTKGTYVFTSVSSDL